MQGLQKSVNTQVNKIKNQVLKVKPQEQPTKPIEFSFNNGSSFSGLQRANTIGGPGGGRSNSNNTRQLVVS